MRFFPITFFSEVTFPSAILNDNGRKTGELKFAKRMVYSRMIYVEDSSLDLTYKFSKNEETKKTKNHVKLWVDGRDYVIDSGRKPGIELLSEEQVQKVLKNLIMGIPDFTDPEFYAEQLIARSGGYLVHNDQRETLTSDWEARISVCVENLRRRKSDPVFKKMSGGSYQPEKKA